LAEVWFALCLVVTTCKKNYDLLCEFRTKSTARKSLHVDAGPRCFKILILSVVIQEQSCAKWSRLRPPCVAQSLVHPILHETPCGNTLPLPDLEFAKNIDTIGQSDSVSFLDATYTSQNASLASVTIPCHRSKLITSRSTFTEDPAVASAKSIPSFIGTLSPHPQKSLISLPRWRSFMDLKCRLHRRIGNQT